MLPAQAQRVWAGIPKIKDADVTELLPDRRLDCGTSSTSAGGMDMQFSFAFQPIVSACTREIVSFEALVRGPKGEPSKDVLDHVDENMAFQFDLACHTRAICLAKSLKLRQTLHLNLFPYALYKTGMNIRATLYASLVNQISIDRVVYEICETQKITDK